MSYPVILILDNDDGLKAVASTVKKCFDIEITTQSTEEFYHITENLYLVKTPETEGKDCIEDLFPKRWVQIRLNGKEFCYKGKVNSETEYGKEIFAKSVVMPNSHDIDFSGFDVLLDRIVAALDHYSRRQSAK